MSGSAGLPQGVPRRFYPQYSTLHREVPERLLVTYNPQKKLSQLQHKHPVTGDIVVDATTVVISIDGACCDNGTTAALVVWGVFFGEGSLFNRSGILRPELSQTSLRAEIEALSEAVRFIEATLARDDTLRYYLIRTGSDFLVRAMSEWIQQWIANDGCSANGQPVEHFSVLEGINGRIQAMEHRGNRRLRFKFWHVPREDNREADPPVNRALPDITTGS